MRISCKCLWQMKIKRRQKNKITNLKTLLGNDHETELNMKDGKRNLNK